MRHLAKISPFTLAGFAAISLVRNDGPPFPERESDTYALLHATDERGQRACFLRFQEHLPALAFPAGPHPRLARGHQ